MTVRNHVTCAPQPKQPREPAAENLKLGGANVRFAHGALQVRGTKNDDEISLQRVDDKTVRLTVNGEQHDFAGVKRAAIHGKKGDDTINLDTNLGIGLKVNGNRGNDTINATKDTFERDASSPAAAATGKHPRVVLKGGAGDDEINSDFDYAKLLGGHGQDTISSGGNDTVIRGGNGNDTLINRGIRAQVHGGRGDDLIVNDGLGSTVRGGRGNDRVLNDDPAARIHGGPGKDRVQDTTGTARVRSAQVVDDL